MWIRNIKGLSTGPYSSFNSLFSRIGFDFVNNLTPMEQITPELDGEPFGKSKTIAINISIPSSRSVPYL